MSISSAFTISLIQFYQTYISPYKGFCCAYHRVTGHPSCSSYALKIVKRCGAIALFSALPRQFERCHTAYQFHTQHIDELKDRKKKPKKDKSGNCGDCGDFEALECVPTKFCDDIGSFAKCDICDCSVVSLFKNISHAYQKKAKSSANFQNK